MYSNQQMHQFYGEDLVEERNDKKSWLNKIKQKKKKVEGLDKAIFKPIQSNLEKEDQQVNGIFDDG